MFVSSFKDFHDSCLFRALSLTMKCLRKSALTVSPVAVCRLNSKTNYNSVTVPYSRRVRMTGFIIGSLLLPRFPSASQLPLVAVSSFKSGRVHIFLSRNSLLTSLLNRSRSITHGDISCYSQSAPRSDRVSMHDSSHRRRADQNKKNGLPSRSESRDDTLNDIVAIIDLDSRGFDHTDCHAHVLRNEFDIEAISARLPRLVLLSQYHHHC